MFVIVIVIVIIIYLIYNKIENNTSEFKVANNKKMIRDSRFEQQLKSVYGIENLRYYDMYMDKSYFICHDDLIKHKNSMICNCATPNITYTMFELYTLSKGKFYKEDYIKHLRDIKKKNTRNM